MAVSTKYFTVTAPQGVSNIKLDSKGNATCQITVKNVSRAAIDGRAVLVSIPPATKAAPGAVEKNWVRIDGTTDRHFAIDQEEVFTIKIAVPQKQAEAPPPGNYSFRMDMINTAKTDESGDQSQALGFTVVAVAPPPPINWKLIAAIAAGVLLIAGGVTTYLLTRGTPVPDVTGKTTTEAYTLLAQVKLILDQNVDHVDSTPENSDKIVSQSPAAGARASAGSMVSVKLGSPMVFMPDLISHSFADAQTMSNHADLGAVTGTTVANDHYGSGIVWDQTPSPGANVRTGTAVTLKVTPQTRTVPLVQNLPFPVAIQRLLEAGLSLGQVQGVPGFGTVIGQNPAVNTQVPIGTPVNLQFACPPFSGCAQALNPAIAHQMAMDAVRVGAIKR